MNTPAFLLALAAALTFAIAIGRANGRDFIAWGLLALDAAWILALLHPVATVHY